MSIRERDGMLSPLHAQAELPCEALCSGVDSLIKRLGGFGATGAASMIAFPTTYYGSPRVEYEHDPGSDDKFVMAKVASPQLDRGGFWFGQLPWPGLQHEEIFVDCGTRAAVRIDLVAALQETSINRFLIDTNTPIKQYSRPTTMSRILELAPLPLRVWAEVFSVTHGSITKWKTADPEQRPELAQVLALLERASREHADLAGWLERPVGSTSVAPLRLLSQKRWRAFLGAIRTASAPVPEVSSETLERWRRERLPWAVTDTPGIPVEA